MPEVNLKAQQQLTCDNIKMKLILLLQLEADGEISVQNSLQRVPASHPLVHSVVVSQLMTVYWGES